MKSIISDFEQQNNNGYLDVILNLLHAIYNDKDKELEILNKIKQFATK